MLKILKPVLISLVVLAVVIGVMAGLSYAQSQSKCYFEPGGVGITAASGCTITLESGAALDVDSGATVTGLSTSTLTSLTAGATVLSETLTVTGATTLNGGLTMDTDAFSVANTSGNTVIKGTLVVTGASDFNNAMNVDANVDADSFSTAGNSDLTTINNSAGDITINDNVDITGTLSLEGATFSGPIKFGSVEATDGLTVTHGLGTTPTAVIITPSWAGDGTAITQSLSVSNINSSTFSIEFTNGDTTTTTAYWMAGR